MKNLNLVDKLLTALKKRKSEQLTQKRKSESPKSPQQIFKGTTFRQNRNNKIEDDSDSSYDSFFDVVKEYSSPKRSSSIYSSIHEPSSPIYEEERLSTAETIHSAKKKSTKT